MNLQQKIGKASHKAKLYLHRFSPTILCCVAAVGVVGTAITAARATPKALRKLKWEQDERGELSKVETFFVMAPAYIPTVAIGAGTIVCIFGANVLNKKQQAALLSAYTLVDQQFKEYKAKLKELYGEEAHNNIMDSIVKERCEEVNLRADGLVGSTSLDPDSDVEEVKRLFYDFFSERYFESTMSRVLQAEYHLNRNFVLSASASLNEFYEFLGLSTIPEGDINGWAIMDESYWIDFNHRTVTLDDGLEVVCIELPDFTPPDEYLY